MQPGRESPYSHFCRLPAPYNNRVDFQAEMRLCAERMRREWDQRAIADAPRAVYTRDSEADVAGFDESGRANYDQLVRPFLPVLLEGRSPGNCRAAEIGCGLGRMTQWFARGFGAVDAVDVSPAMLEQARARLAGSDNVVWRLGSGYDLQPIPDGAATWFSPTSFSSTSPRWRPSSATFARPRASSNRAERSSSSSTAISLRSTARTCGIRGWVRRFPSSRPWG